MGSTEARSLSHQLDEAAIAMAAEADRLRAFNERSIVGGFSALSGVALMTWVLSTSVGWPQAVTWGAMMLGVEVSIILSGLRCRRALRLGVHTRFWRNAQFALAGISGCAWGSAVWFGWTASNQVHYLLTLTIVVGVAGISMVTMAAYSRAALLFYGGINLVPLVHLVVSDVPMSHLIGVGLLVAMVVQLGYCHEIRVVMQRDASQKARNDALLARLNDLVIHDQLTGAYSRRFVFEQLEQAVAARQRSGSSASLIMFDLDHFKSINDTHGHPVGDRALREVVRVVSDRLRGGDTLGRVGGEEFLVLLPATNGPAAAALAEQLRLLLADTSVREGDAVVSLPASFGVAELQSTESPAAWFRRVDQALYQAKASGRNRVVVAA